jgi:acetylornithine/succinyldiaminopimelate/putrescine aminotransferase
MAKSLGGGFPIGAFWVRDPFSNLLGPGSHATTFGGTPLGCAVALRILAVIRRDQLDQNARRMGEYLTEKLKETASRVPHTIRAIRGAGLLIGIELEPGLAALESDGKTAALAMVLKLHEAGMLTIPAGAQVVRWLPPLNLQPSEADEGLRIFESVLMEIGNPRQGTNR